MINYLNSRARWSPEGRNLLNSSGWEDYNGELDYRPERDGPMESVPLPVVRRYGDWQPSYIELAAAYNEPTPIGGRGEPPTRSAPESLPELPGDLAVNGRPSLLFGELAQAAGDAKAQADIIRKHFPGWPTRLDSNGRLIVNVPDNVTTTIDEMPVALPERDVMPGQRIAVAVRGEHYVDRPGISNRNAADFASWAAFQGAPVAAVGLVPGGRVLAPLLGPLVNAGGHALRDWAAQQSGSTKPIDWNAIREDLAKDYFGSLFSGFGK